MKWAATASASPALVAAAIEQNNDSNGIIWPFSIAPFHVLLLPINYRDKAIQAASDRIYQQLQKRRVEVLLDDRDERPGVKFKDADLDRDSLTADGRRQGTGERAGGAALGAATAKLTKSR